MDMKFEVGTYLPNLSNCYNSMINLGTEVHGMQKTP
jgi:hypothetical protein